MYHIVRMKYGIPLELVSIGVYFTGSLDGPDGLDSIDTVGMGIDMGIDVDVNRKGDRRSGMAMDRSVSISNISIPNTPNTPNTHTTPTPTLNNPNNSNISESVMTVGHDWSLDCMTPYASNLFPWINCIWYYKSLNDIKKFYM